MPKRREKYYVDTVTLSNFALIGRLDVLVTRYGKQLRITSEVMDELAAGVVAGYPELLQVEKFLAQHTMTLEPLLASPKERTLYRTLLRTLSAGESSCITCAHYRGGVVVADDRAARECCQERGLAITGTVGILKALCNDKVIRGDEADGLLRAMEEKGYRSPVRRISDIL